jgi:hypothetical protein
MPFRDTAYEVFLWAVAGLVTYFVARWYRNLKKRPPMTQNLEESEPLPDWVSLKDVPLENHPMIRQVQAVVWKAMRRRPAVPLGKPATPPSAERGTAGSPGQAGRKPSAPSG